MNPINYIEDGFAPASLKSLEIRGTLLMHIDANIISGLTDLQNIYLPVNISIARDTFTAVKDSLTTVEIGRLLNLQCTCELWWYEHTQLEDELTCDMDTNIVSYLYKNCVVLNTGWLSTL